jgi:hypothetical protein
MTTTSRPREGTGDSPTIGGRGTLVDVTPLFEHIAQERLNASTNGL